MKMKITLKQSYRVVGNECSHRKCSLKNNIHTRTRGTYCYGCCLYREDVIDLQQLSASCQFSSPARYRSVLACTPAAYAHCIALRNRAFSLGISDHSMPLALIRIQGHSSHLNAYSRLYFFIIISVSLIPSCPWRCRGRKKYKIIQIIHMHLSVIIWSINGRRCKRFW